MRSNYFQVYCPCSLPHTASHPFHLFNSAALAFNSSFEAFSGISVSLRINEDDIPQELQLFSFLGLTIRNLWALAGVDLDRLFVSALVFIFFAVMLRIVDGMVRSAGGSFTLLGDLVKDVGFSFFFGGVVRHVEVSA